MDDLISRKALIADLRTAQGLGAIVAETLVRFVKKQPTVNTLEVVRCKDCKHRGDYPCPMYYEQLVEQNYGDGCIEYEWAEHDRTLDNGFCSMGERKDNG